LDTAAGHEAIESTKTVAQSSAEHAGPQHQQITPNHSLYSPPAELYIIDSAATPLLEAEKMQVMDWVLSQENFPTA